ncbi:MAG: glycerol-3-phosphate dehydrogenase [Pseudomonadota bacterium]
MTSSTEPYDLAVIGGGINGCGIARDAAGRGLKVLLCEQSDLASGTSSASTKLIHGGLRYLEHYEFRLVQESLSERERLWALAPHIVWPMRFVLPHNEELRPAWLIRLGLFLYDHIGGRKLLPGSHMVDLTKDVAGDVLRDDFRRGFEYSDCWVEDSRMVVLNAMDAAERGADVRVRTGVTSVSRQDKSWRLTLTNHETGQTETADAKVIVNAAGPWVAQVAQSSIGMNSKSDIRLVKGSHIVVPKIFDHERSYIFQNADKRIIFAIPYQTNFTLIGTTDVEVDDLADGKKISNGEIDYLCDAASEYFKKPIQPADVVWTYAGVRPLYDDGGGDAQQVTRDFVLERHGPSDGPALLNVFGGKLTTYRRLAEDVLEKLDDCFPEAGKPWTDSAALPGGDFPTQGFENLCETYYASYPWAPETLLHRLTRAYGTCVSDILDGASSMDDLGQHFGHDLYEREIEYLKQKEWARTAEDVLWRRSKLGLFLTPDEQTTLTDWMKAKHVEPV